MRNLPVWTSRIRLAWDWADQWVRRHKTLSIVGVVVFIIATVADAIATDAMLRGLGWFFTVALPWTVQRPMGLGGLILLGWLAVLALAAVWQTRPHTSPEAEANPRTAPTGVEAEQVQRVRVFWNRYAQPASSALDSLFDAARINLPPSLHWIELLREQHMRLRKASMALAEAVDDDSVLGFEEVQALLVEFLGAYFTLARWIGEVHQRHLPLVGEPHLEYLLRWLDANSAFFGDLRQHLMEWPEHRGKLPPDLRFLDQDVRRFLLARTLAELSPPPDSPTG